MSLWPALTKRGSQPLELQPPHSPAFWWCCISTILPIHLQGKLKMRFPGKSLIRKEVKCSFPNEVTRCFWGRRGRKKQSCKLPTDHHAWGQLQVESLKCRSCLLGERQSRGVWNITPPTQRCPQTFAWYHEHADYQGKKNPHTPLNF